MTRRRSGEGAIYGLCAWYFSGLKSNMLLTSCKLVSFWPCLLPVSQWPSKATIDQLTPLSPTRLVARLFWRPSMPIITVIPCLGVIIHRASPLDATSLSTSFLRQELNLFIRINNWMNTHDSYILTTYTYGGNEKKSFSGQNGVGANKALGGCSSARGYIVSAERGISTK